MIVLMVGIGLCVAGIALMVIAIGIRGEADGTAERWKIVCAGYSEQHTEDKGFYERRINGLIGVTNMQDAHIERLKERIEYLEAKISELEKTPGATFNVDDILKREGIIRANETI